jgi:hypothetical protein
LLCFEVMICAAKSVSRRLPACAESAGSSWNSICLSRSPTPNPRYCGMISVPACGIGSDSVTVSVDRSSALTSSLLRSQFSHLWSSPGFVPNMGLGRKASRRRIRSTLVAACIRLEDFLGPALGLPLHRTAEVCRARVLTTSGREPDGELVTMDELASLGERHTLRNAGSEHLESRDLREKVNVMTTQFRSEFVYAGVCRSLVDDGRYTLAIASSTECICRIPHRHLSHQLESPICRSSSRLQVGALGLVTMACSVIQSFRSLIACARAANAAISPNLETVEIRWILA